MYLTTSGATHQPADPSLWLAKTDRPKSRGAWLDENKTRSSRSSSRQSERSEPYPASRGNSPCTAAIPGSWSKKILNQIGFFVTQLIYIVHKSAFSG